MKQGIVRLVGLMMVWGFTVVGAQELVVQPIPGLPRDFIRGADVSMLAQIEEKGGIYYDAQGKPQDALVVLKDHGINWVRLRLWHTPRSPKAVVRDGKIIANKGDLPGGGNNDLARTIMLAQRAKKLGLKIFLDFHYSDFWADPKTQTKPFAWKDLGLNELTTEIYKYTLDVIKQMTAAGVTPDMVQIGNELNNGMLWPEGKIWKDDRDPQVGGMSAFIKLLKSASKAVRDADPSGKAKNIKIVIHLADGGNNALYRSIFDPIVKEKVDFDVIGLSYYCYWHGPLSDLQANLKDLANRYKKELLIAETAYGWTEEDGDSQGNVFKVYDDEQGGYVASVQGQATAVRDVMAAIASVPGGLGIFYWAPEWIPVEGAGWFVGEGNNWENQAMFDFKGRVLPSMQVFNRVYDTKPVQIVPVRAEPVKFRTAPATPVNLPSKIKVEFNDGALRLVDVEWDRHDWTKETSERVFLLTGRVKGATLPVQAEITVSKKINLITDASWESGKLGEWKLNGPSVACFVENNKANARTGSWTYKYWLDKPFKSDLSRTFKNIPNGTYVLSIWAMGGGGENSIKLYARDFGSGKTISVPIVNTGWRAWKQYTIPAIEVTNNQCTIGIYIDANANCWGNFDDVEFYLDTK
ncbi:MAG TPA: glycosyl hydrolase 53 family protein [Termitinemataceae bacterium]|nr:glycosyl hydrolase 53 family protein [Termitinemataceae bacterium]HOM23955.1 glycosyl hydrolase 53 family protein [Termitinemataceae bacterium]HPQ01022.1 glycosyl hydrolase 53 family protein [Termitinemataceae bacterium]